MNGMNFNTDYSNAIDPNAVVKGVSSVAGLFQKSNAQKDLKARCGKKPLIGLTKKAREKRKKFDLCRENINAPIQQPVERVAPRVAPIVPTKSNKTLYIGIGIGLVVIATLVIFRKKIFK
jgi:hypothetical protein